MSDILKSYGQSIPTASGTLFTAPLATTVVVLSGGIYNCTSAAVNLTLSVIKEAGGTVVLASALSISANESYQFPGKMVLEPEDQIVGFCSGAGATISLNYVEHGDVVVDVSSAHTWAIAAAGSASDAADSASAASNTATTYASYLNQGVKTSDTPEFSGLTINGVPVVRSSFNDIGVAGKQGFGVGICPTGFLPSGFTMLPGTETLGHNNYGNYQFRDGSMCVYVPIHWLKIGTGTNGFDVNHFSVLKYSAFSDEAIANASGYFIPRTFKDGGEIQMGYFVDKYQASKNAWGTGFIASSIKNGLPISTAADHNPIANLTACATNIYGEVINAAHARDGENGLVNPNSNWFACSRFIYANLAMLSMAHGQAANSTTNCAWYDPAGLINYPKGNNNDALKDCDDLSVTYISDGYFNCGKTGSGTPFAKTTHNGQNCGIADLNGNMYEISIGVTSDGTDYFVAKEETAMKDFTAGNSATTDHWGAVGIAKNMVSFEIPYFQVDEWLRLGSGTNQVISEDLDGNGAVLRSLGLPKNENSYNTVGTNQFGKDGIYARKLQNELCVISALAWHFSANAGVWGSGWSGARPSSYCRVSFRSACFPVTRRDSASS